MYKIRFGQAKVVTTCCLLLTFLSGSANAGNLQLTSWQSLLSQVMPSLFGDYASAAQSTSDNSGDEDQSGQPPKDGGTGNINPRPKDGP